MERLVLQRLLEVQTQLEQGEAQKAAQAVSQMHPADLARLLEELPETEKKLLFAALPPDSAAEVVVELSDYSREQVLESLATHELTALVDDMPSDEATDIIGDLPAEQASQVLAQLDQEDSDEVLALLKYDEETAGGLMQLELASARTHQSAAQVIEAIRARKDELGELHNVFVVDRLKHVVGVVPLSRLILADPATLMGKLMEPPPFTVHSGEDQESVAHKFRRYDVVSAPVVNREGHLVGRITIDDVMEVLDDEAEEDILRMGGASAQEEVFAGENVLRTSRLRLPWLLSNMVGGLVTGSLLWTIKLDLADALYLLAFIPVIMSMAGNVGVQSSTIMVRGFAVGAVTFHNLGRILFKELRVAMLMGLACGLMVGIVASVWHHKPILGLVVGLAMFSAISTASVLGTLAPALFKRLKVDPAISSGPVVTTMNDITGILVYYLISSLFYSLLVA